MAYAGDLKSSDPKRSCGFDSRPGHQDLPFVCSQLTDLTLLHIHCVSRDSSKDALVNLWVFSLQEI